jgi:hypothetical protein
VSILFLYAADAFTAVVFHWFQRFVVPLPAVDRVPSNTMLYPFFTLMIFSAWGINALLKEPKLNKRSVQIGAWSLLGITVAVLAVHFRGWFLIESQLNMPAYVRPAEFFTWIYNETGDESYKHVVRYSFAWTGMVVVILVSLYMYAKARMMRKPA